MKIYKIWNKQTKSYEGVYSRAYHDEYDFKSPEDALHANFHGTHRNTDIYEVHEIERTDIVVKPIAHSEEDLEKTKKNREWDEKFAKFRKKHPKANSYDFIFAEALMKTMKESGKDTLETSKKYYKKENDEN